MRIREAMTIHMSSGFMYDTAYQFGVYNGDSLIDIKNMFRRKQSPLKKIFGFDSFVGFPENSECEDGSWATGTLNSCEHFGSSNIDECVKSVYDKIRPQLNEETKLELIPGFFSDVCNKELVEKHNMGPAGYIDIDCDLYSSTIDVLEFVVQNGILVPGTYIYYDDWGGTEGWQDCLDGESRAHKEITEKYNITCVKLCQIGGTFPHVQRLFVVVDI